MSPPVTWMALEGKLENEWPPASAELTTPSGASFDCMAIEAQHDMYVCCADDSDVDKGLSAAQDKGRAMHHLMA